VTRRGPVVGIVGAGYTVPRFWGDLPVTGTPRTYVDAVTAAGGVAVVLPLGGPATGLDLVDAVVLAGGGDVDPSRYGGDPAAARDVDRERDEHELAVVRLAAARRLPLLGVCRGLQVLAVAYGGRLAALGHGHVLPETGHEVSVAPGSLLGGLLGPTCTVSSIHDQAVADAGPRWAVTAHSADGVVEACEWSGPEPWPVLGVQWHPERDDTGAALFGWLLARAGRRQPASA
jgi:putative glutamine amidotransferase